MGQSYRLHRRIVEKEMIHFMTDIASFDTPNSEELKKLINEFKVSGKVYLLYENTYKYLPPSLQALGDNPLKLLYQQTSKGLHNLTEDECLKTSEIVDSLLEFVVRKINEEMHEIKEIKKILNKLK